MAIIVSDANVFIDLDAAEITRLMFRLRHEFVVPDVLYQEELSERHAYLPGLGLRIESLDSQTVAETERLLARYAGQGLHDMMALALAKQTDRTLLTGDGKLRTAAAKERVEVRGTLWLMEEMHHAALITVEQMAQAYDIMRQFERRLPWNQVSRQLRRLRAD